MILLSNHLDKENKDHVVIEIILNFIKLSLNYQDEKTFKKTKKLLLDYPIESKEACEDLIGLYDALHNHCGRFLMQGNENYRNDLFDISKNKYFLLANFKINMTANWALIKNISLNAIEIGEFEWAKQFINDNLISVPPEIREDLKNHLFSIIEFRKMNYEKSLELAAKVNMNYHNLKLHTKVTMLSCYFELNAIETALSSIDSFKHYLTNNLKIEPELKSKFNQFIKVYAQLFKFKLNPDSLNGYDIRNIKIESEELSFGKKWVSIKLSEFENQLNNGKKNLKSEVFKNK
ncbi:MAG: hypothetical protein ABI462_00845 [Ignavibacteria bacterium]